ncbi:19551_t:CDS:2, partial [Racocetra fulgida]
EFVKKVREVFDKLTLDVVIIRQVSESNFHSHLKWRIEKDDSFFIVVYKKNIKESFKKLLYESYEVNAFNISRHYDHYKRRNWEHRIPETGEIFKENVMRTALMAKFGQHE